MRRFLSRWKWTITLSVLVAAQLAVIAILVLGGSTFGMPAWFCQFLAVVILARLLVQLSPIFTEIFRSKR